MKLIGRLLSIVVILGALAALCLPADAGAYLYAGKRKKVYCGIVEIVDPLTDTVRNNDAINSVNVCDTSGRCISLFAKLDALNSMKPSGWTFENPLALSQNKLDPAYWRIRVASARNLTRLNVLYFPGASNISLTDEERENLRRFVDGGGVLWVDNASSTSILHFDHNSPFFISQLDFAPLTTGANSADVSTSRNHPLVCSPYYLTDVETMNLGMNAGGPGGGWSRCYCDMGSAGMPTNAPTSFDILFPIIDGMDSNGKLMHTPSVVANTYGSGRVVATANAVGRGCMLPEPYSLPSLKLAFNIMAYASSWTDIRKNPRHTGASIDTLGSNTLVEKWKLALPAPVAGKEYAPLIYKNTVFYTSENKLFALDQNGDTHGGMWPAGPNGEVVIWTWPDISGTSGPAGPLSSPTIATVQNPDPSSNDCGPLEAILVMDSAGTVSVLDAFPINPDSTIIKPIDPLYTMQTVAVGSGSGVGSKWPSPPIYVNGWIYALGGDGRLYAENPCLKKWAAKNTTAVIPGSSPRWACPDLNSELAYASTPKCGPSFGYMKNLNSGAIVGMVYWFDSPATNPPPLSGSTDLNDHVCGVPVSVSMDRVKLQNVNRQEAGGVTTSTTAEVQVTYQGFLTAPDPSNANSAIRILDSNGITPITNYTVELNQKGGIKVNGWITITKLGAIPSSPLVYASYTISYGTGISPNRLDMEIEPKSASSASTGLCHPPTSIEGTPAMGPDNMLYITGKRANTGPSGGSILAYQNDGGAASSGRLKWHYFLHSGVAPSYTPGINVALPGVVKTATGAMMLNPQPCASPAVAGGKVFVTVSGDGGPQGALLCLKANPEFVIRITESGGYDAFGKPIKRPKTLWKLTDQGHYNVKVWQPNLINATSSAVPLMDAVPVGAGINVDYDSGTITFTDFSGTRLQNMGIMTNTFSPSLPVWVWLDNVEVPIDWSTWGPGWMATGNPTVASSDSVDLSGWNNLLWYYIVSDHACTGAHSPPVVIGTTVYFVCDDGFLYALDTETGESMSKETSQKPDWHPKVETGSGVETISKDAAVSVAGSNGVLMVPGPAGLHAFTDTTTLVADNNRVVEVDGAGEVTWAVDSISWPATTPSSAGTAMAIKQGPVNKPSRARYASTGEILFANSGANQVCKIDKGGMVGFDGASGQYVRWVYDKFADPKHLLRPGQPTQLRGPTDAIMWQETEPVASGGTASVVHCLIADSGNSRILDLVYRVKNRQFVNCDGNAFDSAVRPTDADYIDRDSGFVMPDLNWVSKTDSLNERYAFDCLQLVPVTRNDTNGKVNFCQDIWVASSNYASTGTNLGGDSPKGGAGLGGAILAIGYRSRTQGNQSTAPGNWNYDATTSGTITARCDHISLDGKVVPLANPRFFDALIDPSSGTLTGLIICDNYGVYEATVSSTGPPVVGPRLMEKQYRELGRLPGPNGIGMVPIPFQLGESGNWVGPPLIATSAQRLPNGRLLIANSYSGSDKSGAMKFSGEVFEYDLDGTVPWCSPQVKWIDPGNIWKQVTTHTYNLSQPKSAFRRL